MGSTANLGLPFPENTDPLANVAAAIESLAGAVDDATPRKRRSGRFSGTTTSGGGLTIPHGLGVAPTGAVHVQVYNSYALLAYLGPVDATNITVIVRNMTSTATPAAVYASQACTISWSAEA